jgi:hypothetical protein
MAAHDGEVKTITDAGGNIFLQNYYYFCYSDPLYAFARIIDPCIRDASWDANHANELRNELVLVGKIDVKVRVANEIIYSILFLIYFKFIQIYEFCRNRRLVGKT